MDTGKMINVLFVDDEMDNLIGFRATFRRYFNVFVAVSAKEAEKILSKKVIHVLITDQRMPNMLGTELLAIAARKYPYQSRILLTAYADIEALKDAVNRGEIFRYIEKPYNDNEVKVAIEKGYKLTTLKQEKIKMEQEIEQRADDVDSLLKQRGNS